MQLTVIATLDFGKIEGQATCAPINLIHALELLHSLMETELFWAPEHARMEWEVWGG